MSGRIRWSADDKKRVSTSLAISLRNQFASPVCDVLKGRYTRRLDSNGVDMSVFVMRRESLDQTGWMGKKQSAQKVQSSEI